MDAKHLLSCHPFDPALVDRPAEDDPDPTPLSWRDVPGGPGFAYDNEGPRHRVWLELFAVAERAVSQRGLARVHGRRRARPAELWLSDGWHSVQDHDWTAPGYWSQGDGH